jgi:hypothetical protein
MTAWDPEAWHDTRAEPRVHFLERRPNPGLICSCGHLDGEHNLAGDGETRKRCDTGTSTGPCGCQRFKLTVRRFVLVGYEDEPV